MTAATRKTATQGNGGSDNGVTYTDGVNAEVSNLWGVSFEWLSAVAGTNTITATSDTAVVSAVLAYARPKGFYLVPANTNTGAVTINIDSVGAAAIVDLDGNALTSGTLVAGRLYQILYTGSNFRLVGSSSITTGSIDHGVNGGRLTLTTAVPVVTSAVTAATVLYWTPWKGNQIGLYDGASSWAVLAQAEVSIKLTDTQTGSTHNGTKVLDGLTDTSQLIVGMKISGTGIGSGATIQSVDSATQVTATVNSTASASVSITFKLAASLPYDVFGYNNSSALKLEFCKWTNATTRATAPVMQDGVLVKTGATTRRYLGTIATTTTDGQTEFSFGGLSAGGTAGNLLVYNYANRIDTAAMVRDSTNSWSYGTATIRSANGSATMRVNFVQGVLEDMLCAEYSVAFGSSGASVGVGFDGTTFSGAIGYIDTTATAVVVTAVGCFSGTLSSAGLHYAQALEYVVSGATFYGDNGTPTFFQNGLSFCMRM